MTENSNSIFLVLVLIIAAFGATFYVRNLLAKKAALKVIRIFYQHNALGIEGAKSLRELGLERADFLQRMVRPRDYKQFALQMLIKRGIINMTTDERFYMVEERLDQRLRCNSNDSLSNARLS